MKPKVLCEKYSQVSLMGWNPSKIAIFLQSQLLIGVPKSRNNPCLIREKSFIQLINYSRKLNEQQNELLDPHRKYGINLMTPMELFEAHPRVQLNTWTASSIGMFVNCKLLLGIYTGKGRSTLIAERSFFSLIEHSNYILDWKKVYPKK